MAESIKQSSNSFLQKFKGKTSKISKKGVNEVLHQKKMAPQYQHENFYSMDSTRKLKNNPNNKSQFQSDMDELFDSNPEYPRNKKQLSKKLSPIEMPQIVQKKEKHEKSFLPPIYTPEKIYKRDVPSKSRSYADKSESQLQPSISSDKRSKYVFGKYLKLDDEAMKHFEFLKSVEKRPIYRQKSNIISR